MRKASFRARVPKASGRAVIVCFGMIVAGSGAARADGGNDYALPRNMFGQVGMIDMPSARMAPDGELSAGAGYFKNTQRYELGFQVLPWLEGTFRYTGLVHYDPFYPVDYDRSFSLKARLLNETDVLPAVALGINDLVGTGIYSGEYLVASKRFGSFDTTLGMGWGRLATSNLFKNPLALLSDSFAKQRPIFTQAGGTNNSVFFHGPKVGLFGGVVWHTPVDGLSLEAEYSSDRYVLEKAPPEGHGMFTEHNPFNLGVSYQATDGITLGMYWMYGTSIGGNISFQMDPTRSQYREKLAPPVPPAQPRTAEERRRALEALRDGGAQNLRIAAFRQGKSQRSDFANALLDGGYSDVRIDGRTLVLSTPEAGRTSQHCHDAAQIVQYSGDAIDYVMLTGDTRRLSVRCAVPKAQVVRNTAVLRDVDAQAPVQIADIATIDAGEPALRENPAIAITRIRKDLAAQRIVVRALALRGSEAILYFSNLQYFSETEAVGRISRVLMADAPAVIEKLRLISVADPSEPQREFHILRAPLERANEQNDDANVLGGVLAWNAAPMRNPILAEAARGTYPRFSWGIFPEFHQSYFDPNQPVGIDLSVGTTGSVELLPGFTLNAGADTSVYNDFFKDRTSDSLLPHVRTDYLQYLIHGRTGITNLDAEYDFRLAPTVYARARIGYLEDMYAGGGGEILWRPEGERWAVGIDMFEAWQRNFDRLFGLRNYHVLTGLVSVYYQSPWEGINFALRAGRYLARDKGVTFEMTRRFNTGVEIGAFATVTNVSASRYGEGSFDKGIIIRIPIGWALPIENQSEFRMDLRPIQRDGGQRLLGDALLYEETRHTSDGEMREHISEVVDP